jgi:hypothetical protein
MREGSSKRTGSVLVRGLGGRHDGSRVGNGGRIGDGLTGSAGRCRRRRADRCTRRFASLLVAAEPESLETREAALLGRRRAGRRADGGRLVTDRSRRRTRRSRRRTRRGTRCRTHRGRCAGRSTSALLLVASFRVANQDQRPHQSAQDQGHEVPLHWCISLNWTTGSCGHSPRFRRTQLVNHGHARNLG